MWMYDLTESYFNMFMKLVRKKSMTEKETIEWEINSILKETK